ncbi:hypothetical protein BGZ60DRAFT_334024, partial [Tricladium varicosporioides]
INKVAVIGAGPSGLAAARRLVYEGLEVIVYERKHQIGGIWLFEQRLPRKASFPTEIERHTDQPTTTNSRLAEMEDRDEVQSIFAPPSPCYESLVTNIETSLIRFQGYEHPPDADPYVSHTFVLDYLRQFSELSGVSNLVKCNTSVQRVEKAAEGKWKVSVDELDLTLDPEIRLKSYEEIFDAVVVCNGHFSKPYVPRICGLEEWAKKWPGRFLHSRDYRNNSHFYGKNVLIIGGRNSGFDLAREIALVADNVYQSIRSGTDDGRPPRERLIKSAIWSTIPENVIRHVEIATFSSVEKCEEMGHCRINLIDGTSLSEIDFVIFATGYLYSLPFLPDLAFRDSHDDPLGDASIISNGSCLHNLHLDTFYIYDPSLAFVGVPNGISTFSFFDVQSAAIAAAFSGQVALPQSDVMLGIYKRRTFCSPTGKAFHTLGKNKEISLVQAILEWI